MPEYFINIKVQPDSRPDPDYRDRDDAPFWVADLWRMYCRYADNHDGKIEILRVQEGELGGILEIDFVAEGSVKPLMGETGIHCMTRRSLYQDCGIVNTKALVRVLPSQNDYVIPDEDIDIKIFRSGMAAGVYTKPEQAVKLTHTPTGIEVIVCKSPGYGTMRQLQADAMSYLKAKVSANYKAQYELRTLVRDYIIRPDFQLVRDHDSGKSTDKVEEVLNGNLELVW